MSAELKARYQARIDACRKDLQRSRKAFNLMSLLRLIVFFLGIVFTIYTFRINPYLSYATLAAFFAGFVYLVRRHEANAQQREHTRRLIALNEQELQVLDGQLDGLSDGAGFADPEHPNSGDLDLFGPRSIFQLVNRCISDGGRKLLADWLVEPAPVEEVQTRQEAVKELGELLEWRQEFQAWESDPEAHKGGSEDLMEWMRSDSWWHGRTLPVLLCHLLPLFTVPGLVLMFVTPAVPRSIPILLLVTQILIVRFTSFKVLKTYEQCRKTGAVISSYSRLLASIERHEFKAPRLQQLKSAVAISGVPASKRVASLGGYIDQLEVRSNPMMHLTLNPLLLYDLFWMNKLERWKEENRDLIAGWVEAVNEVEVLSSLGGLAFNHPHWCFPEVDEDGPFTVKAEGLGHPLLRTDARVDNDIELRRPPHLMLITGSNMGGKSTWLRSVGVGLVLAFAGGPVCARSFRASRVRVYTSMRTSDSLVESESTFYAELKCIERVVKAVASEEANLFLLDEILRGTNSSDRHLGSKALIHQLVAHQGTGLLATHDLELTKTQQEHPDAIELFYFEALIENGDMTFDYTLRPGICESRNAAYLMKKMGIDIKDSGDTMPPEMDTAEQTQDTEKKQDLEIKDAHLIFESVWKELEEEYGRENLVFPHEIIWLGGAPGAGKGTNTPFIMQARNIDAPPIVISSLLTTPEAQQLKDAGMMVGDREVTSLLLRELMKPEYHDGVVVDGFPRTKVQVECLKMFYHRLMEMHRAFQDSPHAAHFRTPLFRIVLLFVSEAVSVERQLARGEKIRILNRQTRESGIGQLEEERATDLDEDLCRNRYRTFKQTTFDALQSLRKIFHFYFVDAEDSIEEVEKKIEDELSYQSSLELSPATFDIIRNIPLPTELARHARQELVERLEQYREENAALFKHVITVIEKKFIPIIRTHAISGHARINTEDDLFDDPLAIHIALDVFNERGYCAMVDIHKQDIPDRIDPGSQRILCKQKRIFRFDVTFSPSPIGRGLRE